MRTWAWVLRSVNRCEVSCNTLNRGDALEPLNFVAAGIVSIQIYPLVDHLSEYRIVTKPRRDQKSFSYSHPSARRFRFERADRIEDISNLTAVVASDPRR